jgi:hypothetical protein
VVVWAKKYYALLVFALLRDQEAGGERISKKLVFGQSWSRTFDIIFNRIFGTPDINRVVV